MPQKQNIANMRAPSKGQKKKKVVPLPRAPLPTSLAQDLRGLGITVDALTLDAMAEYRRKDETELIIPEVSIKTQLSRGNGNVPTISDRRSYHVHWLVPTPSSNRGSLLSLDRFVCRFENVGAFDLDLTAQQPHGYERSPTAIAAWVLLASRTLKSGATASFDFKPISNENVVPLRSTLKGADCVVPMAFSLSRQGLSPSGDACPATEVGLKVVFEAHYKASGNVVQSGEFFGLRTQSTDVSMSVVDAAPPVPVAIGSLGDNVSMLKVTTGQATISDKTIPVCSLALQVRDKLVTGTDIQGLDVNQRYCLPFPVSGVSTAGAPSTGIYCVFVDKKAGWCVSTTNTTPYSLVCPGDGVKTESVSGNSTYAPCLFVTPLQKYTFSSLPVSSSKLPPHLNLPRLQPANLTATDLSAWKDDVLSAVSFIVGVIKVAAAVAGAAGLLNLINEEEL